jgi:hypothetical protein
MPRSPDFVPHRRKISRKPVDFSDVSKLHITGGALDMATTLCSGERAGRRRVQRLHSARILGGYAPMASLT